MAPAAVLAAAARRASRTVPSRGCPGRRPRGLPRGRRWVATPIMGTLLTSRISWNHSSRRPRRGRGLLLGVLAHYGGLDETAIIWVPLVMIGGLWWILRGGDPSKDEEPPREET